ncbi:MAG: hypothetical protein RL368_593, partial [Pseudomonadota bacterium]
MSIPYHILLVDDEPNLHKQVVPILQKKGFTVETANDGEEGLKKLLSEEFDAAVVDLKMPKMDGFSMIKQANANNINIPMLMLTGKGGTEDAFQASALGVKAWIEKSSLDVPKLSEQLFKLIAENNRSIRPILNALTLK